MRKTTENCMTACPDRPFDSQNCRVTAGFASGASVVIGACLLACLLLHTDISAPTSSAYASTWPAGSSQGSVCLAYGEAYAFDKAAYTHRGVDITASAGEKVRAPVAGTVSFVGRVPSADSLRAGSAGEETMTAASIELEDGRTVTLMPLESVTTKKGQRIEEGEVVGTLAATGDRSSDAPHLHMGLKDGKRYCDPMSLFGNALTESGQVAVPVAAASSADGAGQAVSQSSASKASDTAREKALDAQDRQPASTQEPSFGTISSGETVQVTNDSARVPSPDVIWLPAAIGAACGAQLDGLFAGYSELGQRLHLPAQFLVLASIAFGIAAVAAVLIPLINLIRRNVTHEKVRENSSLCKTKGGASIYGLFPAPGTSFITRGRLAQRR